MDLRDPTHFAEWKQPVSEGHKLLEIHLNNIIKTMR